MVVLAVRERPARKGTGMQTIDEDFTVTNSYGDVLYEIRPGRNLPGFFLNTFEYDNPGHRTKSVSFYFSPDDMFRMALWVLKNVNVQRQKEHDAVSLTSSEA